MLKIFFAGRFMKPLAFLNKRITFLAMTQLLAHKIEIRPNAAQRDYIDRAMGVRRHAFNQLLAHFGQKDVKWSKANAYEYFIKSIRPQFEFYGEVSARVSRNAIDDLDNAFKHFFRRVKEAKGKGKKGKGKNPFGFPVFKKKGENDSFALREAPKFDVSGRELRIEKCPGRIKLRQKLRFAGKTKQVTISKSAGRYFAAILVETADYDAKVGDRLPVIGVDLGLKSLAVVSDGTIIPANQKLKANLRRLQRRQRNLSKKQRGSNRRAKAKLSVARLHERIANQRKAVLHEASDLLSKKADVIVLEDLNVSGMVKNRRLARAVSDAGLRTLRTMIEYKAALRGVTVTIAGRFFPSSKTCSECGCVKQDLTLADRVFHCDDCGFESDRDLNAAINLKRLHALTAGEKRTQEESQTSTQAEAFLMTA
jgi:putative transposase